MALNLARRPIVVFVLGGPGSGKGTQCSRIESHFGFVHVSAGDCLREERSNPKSQYGKMIDDHIREGRIVPVEVTVQLLLNKMRAAGLDGGRFLIDGFPRNENNWDGWHSGMGEDGIGHPAEKEMARAAEDKSIVDVRMCLFLDCQEEEMERRLLERGRDSGRVDDNIDSIRKRFKTFQDETMPIVEKFARVEKLKRINAMRSVDEVWEDVRKTFSEARLT